MSRHSIRLIGETLKGHGYLASFLTSKKLLVRYQLFA